MYQLTPVDTESQERNFHTRKSYQNSTIKKQQVQLVPVRKSIKTFKKKIGPI